MEVKRFLSIHILAALLLLGFVYYVTIFVFIEDCFGIQSSVGLLNSMIFSFLAKLCVFTFLLCVCSDPGGVPSGYVPDVEENQGSDSEFKKNSIQPRQCDKCSAHKPPRAHHCRVCRRCVLRMQDHHCAWINNCVGHKNYKSYLLLVFYTAIASMYSTTLIISCTLHKDWDYNGSNHIKNFYVGCGVLCIGLSLTLGSLLIWHIYLTLHNMTTIEYHEGKRAAWLARKSGMNYHHPYDVGSYKNLTLVLSCKTVFSGYQKVPRSPTPSGGKSFGTEGETRRGAPILAHGDEQLPVSFLADIDSLFLSCQGLTVHYKITMPGYYSRSLSFTTLCDRPSLSIPIKPQFHRSISSQFHSNISPLYTPLLASSPTSPISEDIPILSLNECEEELSKLGSPQKEQDLEANEQLGIVLVHGFGGGVFSWRKIMGVLASQMGCPVAAFDRPGWGLTSRPRKKDWEENQLSNPYKIDNQVDLLLSFCLELGFSSVVLVGHDDGGLLAMKAAQKVHTSSNSMNLDIRGLYY